MIKRYNVMCLFARQIGLEALNGLLESDRYVVDSIFTHKLEPNTNDVRVEYPLYKEIARGRGIPLHIVDKNQKALDILKEKGFDFLVTIGYKYILPIEYLSLARIASLNMHRSLLPRYKGLKPLKRALEDKEVETGVSIHYLTKDVDSGEVIDQVKIPIEVEDSVESLFNKIYPIYPKLLIKTLNQLTEGK